MQQAAAKCAGQESAPEGRLLIGRRLSGGKGGKSRRVPEKRLKPSKTLTAWSVRRGGSCCVGGCVTGKSEFVVGGAAAEIEAHPRISGRVRAVCRRQHQCPIAINVDCASGNRRHEHIAVC